MKTQNRNQSSVSLVKRTSKYFSNEQNEEQQSTFGPKQTTTKVGVRTAPEKSIITTASVTIKENRSTILLHSKLKFQIFEKELLKHFKIVHNNNDTIIADIILPKIAMAFFVVDCKHLESSLEMDRKLDQIIEFSNQFKSAYCLLLVDSQSYVKSSDLQCKAIERISERKKQEEKCKPPTIFIFHSEDEMLRFVLTSVGAESDTLLNKDFIEQSRERLQKKMEILPLFQNVGNIVPIVLREAIPSLEPYQAQVLIDSLKSLENIFQAPSAQYIHEHTPLDLPTSQTIKSVLNQL